MTDPSNRTASVAAAELAARLLRKHLDELTQDWLGRARGCTASGGLDVLVRQADALEHFGQLFPLILDHLEAPSVATWERKLKSWTNTAETKGYPLSAVIRAALLWKNTAADFFDRYPTENTEELVEMAGAVGAAIDEHLFLITDLSYHVAAQVLLGADPDACSAAQLSRYAEPFRRAAQRRAEEIAALTRITTAITGPPDLDRIFQVIAFELAKFYPFDRLAILLKQSANNTYSIRAFSLDGSSELEDNSTAPLPGSALEWVETHRQIAIEHDMQQELRFSHDQTLLEKGLRSCACAPLYSKEQVIGALHLASRQPGAYEKTGTGLLQEIAEELAVAVERARLFEREQKRVAELEIINQIGKVAVATFDLPALLRLVSEGIQKHFSYYDVSLFVIDRERGELVLTAQSGAYADLSPPGYRQKLGVGLLGWCAQHGETVVANDVSKEPRRIIAFPGEIVDGSEVCVPFFTAGEVAGVINAEANEVNAFDDTDVATIETVAGLVSKASENARLYEQTHDLTKFRHSIISTIPSSLLVLDCHHTVLEANRSFCLSRQTTLEQIEGRHLREVFPPELLEAADLQSRLGRVLADGKPITLRNIRFATLGRPAKIFNFYLAQITSGNQPRVLLVEEDVTEAVEGSYRLSMLRQINEAIQGTLDLDTLLHQVLTCVTAGPALGFNRAFLLMVDKDEKLLQGKMGVGPASQQDAVRIWQDINQGERGLTELLAETSYLANKEKLPLYPLARRLRFALDELGELPVQTVHDKKTFVVKDAHGDPRVSPRLYGLLHADEFVSVPLIAKDEAVGVILADNLYSQQPITDPRVEMLTIFANHAGLALENAEAYANLASQMRELEQAYQRLEVAQDRRARTEKLAAIGEMAAHVAHEIRNPLVTIGGFARSILRTLGPEHRCTKPARIIVDEVVRLEKILASVMDFTKPSTPWCAPSLINEIVEQSLTLLTHELQAQRITVTRHLAADLPQLLVDAEQLKQAFLNILKNAVESIESGGRITVTTRLEANEVRIDFQDTGKGMPPDVLDKLFSPFFTTKEDGTGLGLAVTQKIIENHDGRISVTSKRGVGTAFTIFLPTPDKK